VRFHESLLLSLPELEGFLFFLLLLQEEKEAKPEKDDCYYDVLCHPRREIMNAILRGLGRGSIYIA